MNSFINCERLVFTITHQCTSKCSHCFIDKNTVVKSHISAEEADGVMSFMAREYNIDSVLTYGGEPLLYPEIIASIHSRAAELGIPKRQIFTNGFWSTKRERNEQIADLLRKASVNSISLSVDYFHQQNIPLQTVVSTIELLLSRDLGCIILTPCWVGSIDADNIYNRKTREILDILSRFKLPVGKGNILSPVGEGRESHDSLFHKSWDFKERYCATMQHMNDFYRVRTLCIEPSGVIALCRGIVIGNIRKDTMGTILEKYDPNENADILLMVRDGLDALIAKARGLGIEMEREGYYSLCDACVKIRSNEKWIAAAAGSQ